MTIKRLEHPKTVIYNETQGVYLTDILQQAQIKLRECGVGNAVLTVDNDFSAYPDYVVGNDSLIVSVGETTATAQPIFKGRVMFPNSAISKDKNTVDLTLQHAGYGLCDMFVAEQYGAQSKWSSLDTLHEILTNSSYGIIPAYVDKQLNGASSGWSLGGAYLTDHVANPTEVINWAEFPYKTADKAINDIVDRVTALKAGDAGPHWIVDNYGFFRLKMLGTSQNAAAGSGTVNWTQWYGDSQENATIRLGEDYDLLNYEEMKPSGNYIVNYCPYRYPASGDAWTEDSGLWTVYEHGTLSTDTAEYMTGTASIKLTHGTNGTQAAYYPSTQDIGLNVNNIGVPGNPPYLTFDFMRNGISTASVSLNTSSTSYSTCSLYGGANGDLTNGDGIWTRLNIPIGPYRWQAKNGQKARWADATGAGYTGVDWSNINYIKFIFTSVSTSAYIHFDSIGFEGLICRVAYDSSQPVTRMRFINDMTPCDDSLVANDASGTAAVLTAAELLRQNKTVYCPTLKVPILPDALPGQQFYFNDTTYRAIQIDHSIVGDDMTTTLTLTSDLTNGLARKRYEDYNTQLTNERPHTQDRNATSVSRNNVDITVPRLAKDYAP